MWTTLQRWVFGSGHTHTAGNPGVVDDVTTPPAAPPPPMGAWRTAPVIQRVVEPLRTTLQPDTFRAQLSAHRSLALLAPLTHAVDPQGPAGALETSAVQSATEPPTPASGTDVVAAGTPGELPLVQRNATLDGARPRPHGIASSRSSWPTLGAATTDVPSAQAAGSHGSTTDRATHEAASIVEPVVRPQPPVPGPLTIAPAPDLPLVQRSVVETPGETPDPPPAQRSVVETPGETPDPPPAQRSVIETPGEVPDPPLVQRPVVETPREAPDLPLVQRPVVETPREAPDPPLVQRSVVETPGEAPDPPPAQRSVVEPSVQAPAEPPVQRPVVAARPPDSSGGDLPLLGTERTTTGSIVAPVQRSLGTPGSPAVSGPPTPPVAQAASRGGSSASATPRVKSLTRDLSSGLAAPKSVDDAPRVGAGTADPVISRLRADGTPRLGLGAPLPPGTPRGLRTTSTGTPAGTDGDGPMVQRSVPGEPQVLSEVPVLGDRPGLGDEAGPAHVRADPSDPDLGSPTGPGSGTDDPENRGDLPVATGPSPTPQSGMQTGALPRTPNATAPSGQSVQRLVDGSFPGMDDTASPSILEPPSGPPPGPPPGPPSEPGTDSGPTGLAAVPQAVVADQPMADLPLVGERPLTLGLLDPTRAPEAAASTAAPLITSRPGPTQAAASREGMSDRTIPAAQPGHPGVVQRVQQPALLGPEPIGSRTSMDGARRLGPSIAPVPGVGQSDSGSAASPFADAGQVAVTAGIAHRAPDGSVVFDRLPVGPSVQRLSLPSLPRTPLPSAPSMPSLPTAPSKTSLPTAPSMASLPTAPSGLPSGLPPTPALPVLPGAGYLQDAGGTALHEGATSVGTELSNAADSATRGAAQAAQTASVTTQDAVADAASSTADALGDAVGAGPTAAGPTATGPTAPAGGATAAGPTAAGPQVDELVQRLFDPLAARIRAELRLDRERAGLTTDLRR